jgi:hypothetical protein
MIRLHNISMLFSILKSIAGKVTNFLPKDDYDLKVDVKKAYAADDRVNSISASTGGFSGRVASNYGDIVQQQLAKFSASPTSNLPSFRHSQIFMSSFACCRQGRVIF